MTASGGSMGGTASSKDAGPSDAANGRDSPSAGGQGGGGGPDATAARDTIAADLPPIPDAFVRFDTPPLFWTTSSYAQNCTPPSIGGRSENDGHHRQGEDCMRSGCHLNPKKAHHHAGTDCRGSGCHANGSKDGSGAPAFLFGGTVYQAGTLAANPNIEVAVKAASTSYSACSATNGNFWYVPPSGTTGINWTGASARLRGANGEAAMMSPAAAGCNAATCHIGVLRMTSP